MQAFTLVPESPRRYFALVAQGLPEEVVAAIRNSTDSTRKCAARHHVAQSTVVRIRNGLLREHGVKRTLWIRVSDDTVEEMRVRREESGWSLGQLARFYKLPRATVQKICEYRRR